MFENLIVSMQKNVLSHFINLHEKVDLFGVNANKLLIIIF